MSRTAQTLLELRRLAQAGGGALTEHLLHEVAAQLIEFGADDAAHNGDSHVGKHAVPEQVALA